MLNDVTLGQYYPTTSFVHKMDARIKILLNIFYLIGIFFATSFFAFGIILVFLLIAVAFSRVPLSSVLKSIKGIMFIVIFTSILNVFFTSPSETSKLLVDWWIFQIYDTGLIFAGYMMLRLIFLVLGASLLTLTTTPVELTHGIESLLYPLTLIKAPVHELALIMSLALAFIPTLIEETDRIIRAQKARGANFDTGNIFKRAGAFVPILIPLLISSFRRAGETALAMDSRCYEGSTKRTKMQKMRLSWRDAVGTLVIAIFFTMVFLIRDMSLGRGFLPIIKWMIF
ncbi:MAG: energy-coupling factor transporter transmembrane component T [Clostridia bacterium]